MDHHLDKGKEDGRLNSRNGYGRKSVFTATGKIAWIFHAIVWRPSIPTRPSRRTRTSSGRDVPCASLRNSLN
jgi:hypothetical protein